MEEYLVVLTTHSMMGSKVSTFSMTSISRVPYTESFVGALDDIFVGTDHLQVTATVTFPSLEEVRELVALPSVHFPSDHVALVCDVSWKSPINKVNVLQMC